MKSDHRHELKSNELAQWIADLPEWARQNSRTILITCGVVVALVLAYAWYHYEKNVASVNRRVQFSEMANQLYAHKRQAAQGGTQGQDLAFTLLQSADSLGQFAGKSRDRAASALAHLKRAEAIRAELHYRPAPTPDQVARQVELAKTSYQQALDKAGDQVSLRAAAQYGLGLCAEETGDQAQARQIYQQIVADARLKGTVAQAAAGYRLKTMDDYTGSVVFRPGPEPVSQPAPAVIAPAGPNAVPTPAGPNAVPVPAGPNVSSAPEPAPVQPPPAGPNAPVR
ncbi:MAG: hypothetical protein KBE04_07705 [Phycisphaerae bacterium]|nr:hypothetical protein [Phycisphaerae bacterium]